MDQIATISAPGKRIHGRSEMSAIVPIIVRAAQGNVEWSSLRARVVHEPRRTRAKNALPAKYESG